MKMSVTTAREPRQVFIALGIDRKQRGVMWAMFARSGFIDGLLSAGLGERSTRHMASKQDGKST